MKLKTQNTENFQSFLLLSSAFEIQLKFCDSWACCFAKKISSAGNSSKSAATLRSPEFNIEPISQGIVRISYLAPTNENEVNNKESRSSIWLKKQGTWTLQFRHNSKDESDVRTGPLDGRG